MSFLTFQEVHVMMDFQMRSKTVNEMKKDHNLCLRSNRLLISTYAYIFSHSPNRERESQSENRRKKMYVELSGRISIE